VSRLASTALAFVACGIPCFLPAQPVGVRATDVFIVAHQDDWQLFMGDVAFKGVRRGNRAIFIYLTAGDENRGSGYWRARERAALQSTRLAAAAPADSAFNCGPVTVLTHATERCSIANTVSYFLRLPDGGRGGSGFEHNSFQSLRKLRAARIAGIKAVDGTSVFRDWNDLTSTIEQLIRRELPAGTSVAVHTNDPNPVVNPRDHSDHRMAGLVGAQLKKDRGWALIYYVGYAIAGRPDNRSRAQIRQKTALFLVYDREMLLADPAWATYAERPRFYSMCMLRTYARKVRGRPLAVSAGGAP